MGENSPPTTTTPTAGDFPHAIRQPLGAERDAAIHETVVAVELPLQRQLEVGITLGGRKVTVVRLFLSG